ncbi:DNA translocase FtsK [Galenea microaerophila]
MIPVKKIKQSPSETPSKTDTLSGEDQLTEKSAEQTAKASMFSLHWIFKDGLLLTSIATAIFLFLILFSYDGRDPAFNSAGMVQTIHNYGGRTGAWLASMLLYIVGVFAFILPFGLMIASSLALWANQNLSPEAERDYSRYFTSLIGLLLLVISGSALATLFIPSNFWGIAYPYSSGGVLGYELSHRLVAAVDLLGATLILLVVFAWAISMILNLSWLQIFEYTGQASEWLYHQAKPVLKKVQDYAIKVIKQVKQKKKNVDDDQSEKEKNLEIQGESRNKNLKVKLAIPTLKSSSVFTDLKDKGALKKDASNGSTASTASEVKVGSREPTISEFNAPQGSAELPSLALLDEPPIYEEGYSEEQLRDLSSLLEQKLEEFGIKVKVESVQPGPVVTRFEILPAPGVKVSQINNLSKDLARVLSVKSVRVVDIIPGKTVIGIEIPNEERELVSFREILASDAFQNASSKLTVALGKDIAGKPVVADIAKMPHLLVAGTTGSGKSVGVNSMILSLLYKATPEEVRLIMVDPKMLELSVYDDIPHLLTPVVTDMSEAANALRWCVFEMDRRYQLMAKLGVRNIAGFNAKVQGAIDKGNPIIDPLYQQKASFGLEKGEKPPTLEPLPFIVVVVDEFADMIMVVGKEVEQLIARIAQKARAAGIHLILATQRPSVNVITGLIKANIPTRISFMVNTKIDSRTILDQGGAEQLLGMGDMLYLPPGTGTPKRVHGAFVSDEEVHRVVDFVKSQGKPQYLEVITKMNSAEEAQGAGSADAEQDPIYDEAVAFVAEKRRVSISLIQRQFKIGYNRAARIVEAMESAGLISKPGSNGNREILIPEHN